MKYAVVIYFLIFGCSIEGFAQDTSGIKRVQEPVLNIETTAYVGDILFTETLTSGNLVECVIPNFEYRKSTNFGAAEIFIMREVPLCKKNNKDKYYPPYPNWISGTDGSSGSTFPVKLKSKGDLVEFRLDVGIGSEKITAVDRSKFIIESRPDPRYKSQTKIKNIELLGISGSIVRFIYIENDGSDKSIERTFEVDTSEDQMVFWRGLEMEVMNVSRGNITYRVLKSFS
tara:strand:- start:75 stop:761 length:687 start_codon:yes stop_codon:yes gene_type:complete